MPNASQEPHNLLRLWLCVVVGVAIWFSPTPEGLTSAAWHVFAVFVATIVSFLLRPLPMGVCVLLGLLVLAGTGELFYATEKGRRYHNHWQWQPVDLESFESVGGPAEPGVRVNIPVRFPPLAQWNAPDWPEYPRGEMKGSFKQALSGFADTTTWLVVAAFLIAGAMVRSGLGRRLALALIGRLGGTTLGLGYGIAAAELLLGPFVPSNTARGGGVMAPIVNSLARAFEPKEESTPGAPDAPSPSPSRDAEEGDKTGIGRYLVLVGAHANLVTAAMFLTGMAANPLAAKAAEDVLGVEFGWGRWFAGAIVPGLVSLAILPWLMHRLTRPTASGSEAQDEARTELAEMGPWTAKQMALAAVLFGMLVLWATASLQKEWLGYSLPTALVALGGVVLLVVLGVERWKDITGNAAAWDTLVWLGGLVTMANALRDTGFTEWFAENIGQMVTGWPALATALALAIAYFYSMYCFSMLTGHILAMAGVFFAVGAAAGAPPLLLVPLVAYFSNLCGCTTHYSTGPVVIYFGLGYVPVGRWFAIGFVMSLVHLAVWLGVGLPWWKLLGWW